VVRGATVLVVHNGVMERFTTSDGVAVAFHSFRAEHPRPGLPPVLLQHGFAADSNVNWVRFGTVEALNAAGRTAIAVDARGHGESDKPHDPALYGEARMARDLAELLDHLELPQVDLVGYSMGAIVALILATTDIRIRRLVVGGVGASVVEMGGADTRRFDGSLLAAALRAPRPDDVADASARSFRFFAESTGGDLLALAAQAERVHGERIPLDRITVPTLVLAGDADPLAVRPEVLAQAIHGAQVHLVRGEHLGVVGRPEFKDAIVAFLSG
jgi:pimeloyl-ACP methyl ester carboxylesterase